MITRFAPSPTGPLHLGHAYSAILGHDIARAAGGQFLLRMEDTDLERCKPEWDQLIQDDLTWLGLTWDGQIHRQSDHLDSYTARLQPLIDQGLLYPCSCTRADIRAATDAPQEGVQHNVYPGTCRHRRMDDAEDGDALRLDLARALDTLDPSKLTFTEAGASFLGTHRIDRATVIAEIGDVVLRRKSDGIIAYFMASTLDDADQNISMVIRGEDLFSFVPIQVILQHLLDLPTPIYNHHKLIRDDNGKRLAKRDDARAIRKYRDDGLTPDDIRRLVGLA